VGSKNIGPSNILLVIINEWSGGIECNHATHEHTNNVKSSIIYKIEVDKNLCKV